ESITYGIDASDHDPSTTARTVTLNTVSDNGGGADTNTDISETATISVTAVNEAPPQLDPPEPDPDPESDDPETVDPVVQFPVIPNITIPDNPAPDPAERDVIIPVVPAPDDGPVSNPELVDPEQEEPEPTNSEPAQGGTTPPEPVVSAPVDGLDVRRAEGKEQVYPSADTKAAAYAMADALLESKPIWEYMGVVQQQMQEVNQLQERELAITVGAVEGITTLMLAGYVVWIFRGGTLLSAILATIPAWKNFDPLPILDLSEKQRKRLRKRQRDDRQGRWRDDNVGDDDAELTWLVDDAECTTKGEELC
ncbi:MAG: hypothetical protein GY794_17705, partial [bacterium]|nr:hypothetical protein [bacterium]